MERIYLGVLRQHLQGQQHIAFTISHPSVKMLNTKHKAQVSPATKTRGQTNHGSPRAMFENWASQQAASSWEVFWRGPGRWSRNHAVHREIANPSHRDSAVWRRS
mmetsp:Transcript_7731/g.16013  ORF Transcript_7731/g.16013 Transcript_7731/m.16013 type:complete len:105 (-) Transcript_7731:237-551(-)